MNGNFEHFVIQYRLYDHLQLNHYKRHDQKRKVFYSRTYLRLAGLFEDTSMIIGVS